MPVLECNCGMVMSISATISRAKCIRCGGVRFRQLFVGRVTAINPIETTQAAACATPNLGWSSELLQVELALLPLAACARLH